MDRTHSIHRRDSSIPARSQCRSTTFGGKAKCVLDHLSLLHIGPLCSHTRWVMLHARAFGIFAFHKTNEV